MVRLEPFATLRPFAILRCVWFLASQRAIGMALVPLIPSAAPADIWTAGVKHLQWMLPPKGFPMDRWALVCSDCARLLEQHGSDLRRLGWSAEDAFGAHPSAPAAAVRCYGLGMLLGGGEVVELAVDHARVKRPSGALLTFMRTANPGAVPIWAVE